MNTMTELQWILTHRPGNRTEEEEGAMQVFRETVEQISASNVRRDPAVTVRVPL